MKQFLKHLNKLNYEVKTSLRIIDDILKELREE